MNPSLPSGLLQPASGTTAIHQPQINQARIRYVAPAVLPSVTFSGDATTAPVSDTEKLKAGEIVKEVFKQLEDPHTGKAIKALSYQYGPELILPVMLSVPVLGWGAALFALPFTLWLSHQGEKMVEEHMKEIPEKNPFHHVYNIQHDWDNPRANNDLSKRLVSHYNKLVDTLFTTDNEKTAKLRKSLKVSPNVHESRAFRLLNRLVNARQKYWKSWYLSYPLKPLDWVSGGLSKFLPRTISMIPQIPKFSLIGLFFLMGAGPAKAKTG